MPKPPARAHSSSVKRSQGAVTKPRVGKKVPSPIAGKAKASAPQPVDELTPEAMRRIQSVKLSGKYRRRLG